MAELQQQAGMFDGIISGLAGRNNFEDGDYLDNEGFLMCGKCHTRKQSDVDILGDVRRVPVICKCEQEERAREEERRKMHEMKLRIGRLRQDGIADPEYLRWTLENDDGQNAKISAAVRRYIDKWEDMREKNIGIMFYGNVGTGKSFFAACIANAIIEKGIPAIMTNIPSLITALSKDFEKDKAQLLRRISEVPLLVLDDVGVERDTAFAYEKLQEIVDTRYRSGKPLIITTNLSPKELASPPDIKYKRVYDRLLEMCYPILVDGTSRRMKKAYDKSRDARSMLGL